MKKEIMTVMAGMMVIGASAAFAGTESPVIDQRQQNQQQRIDQGVASGQLTPREAGRLEAGQARVEQREARMKSDGALSKKERVQLTRQQNRASKRIYRQKHDRQTAR